MFADAVRYSQGALAAQERGFQHGNALLGGFDPIGLLAGLSFIAFLLHALLSFLFRPQHSAASFYLPQHAASSRGGPDAAAGVGDALDFYDKMNTEHNGIKNRH